VDEELGSGRELREAAESAPDVVSGRAVSHRTRKHHVLYVGVTDEDSRSR